jgi:RimJ/RimL family protein N-acetyltransferase
MSDIILRQALLTDQPSLANLEQKVIQAERPYNASIKSTATRYYDLTHLLTQPDSYVLLAELNGEIVGTGYVQIRPSKQSLQHQLHGYLGFMYVVPACRGAGLNQRIIDSLIQWSKKQKVSDFYLDVYHDNQGAVRAYEKAGFVKSMVEMKLNLD